MKFKSLTLAMAFAALSATAFAQDPTTSAPTPTHSADKVKSAFSDHYTAFTKWDRQHGATMETVTINGNDNVLKFSGDYVAVSLGGRKLNDMEYLHADVYAPTSGGVSQVRFGFALFSGGEKYADAYNTDTPAGEWVSIDIPLTAFGGYDFSNTQVFRMTMTKTPGNTFYMDNVYFYTKDGDGTPVDPVDPTPTPTPGDLTHAPKPTHAASAVKSAFSDNYTAFTKWDRLHGATMELVDLGDNDKVAKLSGDYVAISLGGRKLNDMEYMHADIFSPTEGGVSKVRFGFSLFSGGEKYADDYNTVTPGGVWTSVDIPLSAFNGYVFADTQVLRMTMDKTNGNTFYLDNVYFYTTAGGEDPTPPVTPFAIKPAPVPTNDASTVKSVYSDAYTSACTFTNAGGNSGIEEVEVAITDNDKARKLTGYNYIKYGVGTLDVSDMVYLHVDVATPDGSDACATIQPVLVNGNTSFYTGSPELAKGKWTSLNIKLADFTAKGLDASAINEIRFKHSGTGSIVIDNIYFCTEEGAKGNTDAGWSSGGGSEDPGLDIPLAPVPTRDAADVKAFFSDAYPNLFGKFEITTYGEGKIEIIDHAEGQQVCRITNFNWVPINLGARDVSDKGYVHIDFYTPASDAVASINVGFQNWNAANGSAYEIVGEDANYRALVPGQWNSFDIPLSHFYDFDFATQMAVLRLRKGGSGKTLYVDNVYFWGEPGGGEDPGDKDKFPPIQDDSDGELPNMNTPMLGVNLSSASGGSVPGTFGYDYMYPRFQDLYYFKAKGVRLIRLPFRAARFIEDIKNPEPDYANDNKSDVAAMKAVVAEAERLGIWVFLDAHDYAERTIDGTQYKIGEGEYTIERFAKMWGAIANEFKEYTNIWGYDLQNEPKVTAQVLVEAYQAAIDEIRKVDTRAQIIVEGTNWASAYEWIYGNHADKQYPGYSTEVAWSYKENSPWLLAGLQDPQNKIVFQAHGYFDKDNSGTYKSGYTDVDYRKRFLPFLEWCRTNNAKGLIGEFGVPYTEHSTGDPRYMEMLEGALQLFREYGMNATYWCAGAMYEGNSLTCQPDKSALYGNYAKEKSTMKVLEKYFIDWANNSAIDHVGVDAPARNDNRTYNLLGIEVDETYVGIVIRNGKKYIQK